MSHNKSKNSIGPSASGRSSSVKRPVNSEYLSRLAQPKKKGSYVLMKESSSEGESSGDENYKRLKAKREERKMIKHGVDFANLISRESPRNKKGKKKKKDPLKDKKAIPKPVKQKADSRKSIKSSSTKTGLKRESKIREAIRRGSQPKQEIVSLKIIFLESKRR